MTTLDPFALFLASLRVVVRDAVVDALASAGPSPQSNDTPTRLRTKQEMADQLGISTAQLDRLCRQGRIPFVHVGDVRRFDPTAVLDALKKSTDPAKVTKQVQADPAKRPARVHGVRLLSRGKG